MRLLRAWILLLLTACSEFALVDPASNGETSLQIFLSQREDTTVALGISGVFFAGMDGSGRGISLEDSTLTVESNPATVRTFGERVIRYEWSSVFTDPGSVPQSLHLRGPTLSDAPSAPEFALLVPRRRQPFRFDLAAGEDLVLDASNAPINATRESATFAVRIERDGDGILTTQAETTLPNPLHIPWAWLADRVGVGDSLDVSVSRFESYELDTSQYRTSVALLSAFSWRVRIVAPSSPAP